MSAGKFIRSRYITNGGAIARIRVQPETELASIGGTLNSAPVGAPTVPSRAKVSKGRREVGIGPRKIGVAFSPGQEPDGYEPDTIIYVPALTRTFYDAAVVDQTMTYLTSQAVIVSKLEESVR